jgi:hypothetical protein
VKSSVDRIVGDNYRQEERTALSFREELVSRVKRGPAWLRRPLRAALQAWKRIEPEALGAMLVIPRAVKRMKPERRVLGIYHLQEHAGHLGDFVDFLEILQVLRLQHGLRRVDLVYIDDPSNPNRPVSRQRLDASSEYKQMMLDLRALLPDLGALYQFDSDAEFERFFRSNFFRYVCWPRYPYLHTWPSHLDYSRLSDRGYPYPNVFKPLDDYFASRGQLPTLSCPEPLLEWAREFVRAHASPAIPIALQLRFNPDSPVRNTDAEAWTRFLRHMESRREFKFMVMSRREEILPELRQLKNVVYSKDYSSGVMNDLALLQLCHLSMFPDAGFVTFPWFCGLPTIFFAKQRHEFPHRRIGDEHGTGLRFLTRFQRRRYGDYNADTLEKDFLSLCNDLAAVRWTNPYVNPIRAGRQTIAPEVRD